MKYICFLWLLLSLTTKTAENNLNLEDKIAQLCIIPVISSHDLNRQFIKDSPYNFGGSYIESMVTNYNVGGVIFLGAGIPEEQMKSMNRLQMISKNKLLIAQDAEWGLSMRLQKDVITLPKAMTLGALSQEDDALIFKLGEEIGKQCKAIGVDINFAPVVDVNNNPYNPIINVRSFGEDPDCVGRKAKLFMQGMEKMGILCCAKHFPGHGDTCVDSHCALPIVGHDQKRLDSCELIPFKELIKANVPMIMTAHLAVPQITGDNKAATLSSKILKDLLRIQLKFEGCIITDGLGMKALTNEYTPGEIELEALLAGNDILLCPIDLPKVIKRIKQAVQDGEISEKELDARVVKMQRLKEKIAKKCFPIAYNKQLLQSPSCKELKQQIYRAALTHIGNQLKSLQPTETIDLVTISDKSDEPFAQYLQKYCQVHEHFIAIAQSSDAYENIVSQLTSKTKILIALHLASRSGMIEMTNNSESNSNCVNLIQKLRDKTILVLFGNPYNLSKWDDAKTTLIAYENTPEAQEAAARALAGKLQPRGKLPVLQEKQLSLFDSLVKKQ